MSETKILPVLPLRDIVVFPHMVVPLFVGREKSVRALEAVMNGDAPILLAALHQRELLGVGSFQAFPFAFQGGEAGVQARVLGVEVAFPGLQGGAAFLGGLGG